MQVIAIRIIGASTSFLADQCECTKLSQSQIRSHIHTNVVEIRLSAGRNRQRKATCEAHSAVGEIAQAGHDAG